MEFNKELFNFIGYMSFFDPIGMGPASDCSGHEDEVEEDVRNTLSEASDEDDWDEI